MRSPCRSRSRRSRSATASSCEALFAGLISVGALCCAPPPAPPPPSDPPRAEAVAAAEAAPAPAPPPPAPADGPPQVVLVWEQISPLYRSFFSTPELVSALAADLAGYAAGNVNVQIRWDQAEQTGWIRLVLLPGTLTRVPAVDGGLVRLSDLAPLTTALASYRSAVSARFDVRVQSFIVEVSSVQGPRHCLIQLAGLPPPDGRTISPCVQINGAERCGAVEAEGVRFAPEVAADLQACLNPR